MISRPSVEVFVFVETCWVSIALTTLVYFIDVFRLIQLDR